MPFLRKFFPRFLDKFFPEPIPNEEEYKYWYVPKTVQPVLDIEKDIRRDRLFFVSESETVTDASTPGYYCRVTLERGKMYQLFGVIGYTGQGNASVSRIVWGISQPASGYSWFRLTDNLAADNVLWATFPGGVLITQGNKSDEDTTYGGGGIIDYYNPPSLAIYMDTPPPTGTSDNIVMRAWGIVFDR